MKGACENDSHPRGTLTGLVVTRFESGNYTIQRVCQVCGKVQGIALVRPRKDRT